MDTVVTRGFSLLLSVIFVNTFIFGPSSGQRYPVSPSPCPTIDALTCGECVQGGGYCAWCSDTSFNTKLYGRCNGYWDLKDAGCDDGKIVSEAPLITNVTDNEHNDNSRLLRPQRTDVQIPPGSAFSVKIHVSFRQPSNTKNEETAVMRIPKQSSLSFEITSDCISEEDLMSRTKKNRLSCPNIQPGQIIKMQIHITVLNCEAPLTIPVWLMAKTDSRSVKMKINVKKICQCDCERPEEQVPQSPVCSGNGTFMCGSCACNDGYYGRRCDCGAVDYGDHPCTDPYSTRAIPCSGRGQCICGICECFTRSPNSAEKYSGQYCECDDYSCSYHNNQICGGNGVCTCGVCRCDEGFEGDACECPKSFDTCTSNGLVCNDKGSCQCGVCQCEAPYRGPTCQECPTCAGKCQSLKRCVQCKAFNTGPMPEEECVRRCEEEHPANFTIYDDETYNSASSGYTNAHHCQFKDDGDCVFHFFYMYMDSIWMQVIIKRTKECPAPIATYPPTTTDGVVTTTRHDVPTTDNGISQEPVSEPEVSEPPMTRHGITGLVSEPEESETRTKGHEVSQEPFSEPELSRSPVPGSEPEETSTADHGISAAPTVESTTSGASRLGWW